MSSEIHQLFTRLTASAAPSAATFTGTYETTIVALFMNQSILAKVLPDRLELRPDTSTPSGMHPLIVTFGVQRNVAGTLLPIPLTYAESAIGIPRVGVKGSPSEYLDVYLTRLDVNNGIAVALGLTIGYPKQLSVINQSVQQFNVLAPLTRAQILQAVMNPTTGWKTAADFPLFGYVMGLLANPIVSVDAARRLIYSRYQWDFANAQVQGATSRLNVMGDLPALPRSVYTFDSIESTALGAAHVIVPWTLSGPYLDRP